MFGNVAFIPKLQIFARIKAFWVSFRKIYNITVFRLQYGKLGMKALIPALQHNSKCRVTLLPILVLLCIHIGWVAHGSNNQTGKICLGSEQSVEKALKFIASKQREDGTWVPFDIDFYPLFINSINGLALMASGSTSKEGPYQKELTKAREAVMKFTRQVLNKEVKPRYHCIPEEIVGAAIFLAHVYHSEKTDELKEILEKILELLINIQKKDGGWNYIESEQGGMTYVTTNAVVALLLLDHVGIKVKKEIFDKARKFYEQGELQSAAGTFIYYMNMPSNLARTNILNAALGRTVAALCPMYLLGLSKAKTYEKAKEVADKYGDRIITSHHGACYHLFWCGLAFFYTEDKKLWERYWKKWSDPVLKGQKEDGSIFIEPYSGTAYPLEGRKLKHEYSWTLYTTPQYTILLQLDKGHLLFGKLKS